MEKLQVELGSVVSGLNVSLELPTIIQTSGLPQDDALAFVKDCADGKRKIAKAVRDKYEGTSGTASEITEYSTFEELSNKISQIPVEVPLGNAMEQNGGVLPFYDVYNEALKAMKEFAGYGFNGCCAFELDKWSYDDDHKVTLSGADAYYTSDGTFIKDNIIYKNGSQIGELDNSLYQFQDQDAENTNRFVVYFFVNERYQVPKTLHATSCLNLWCVKGTPLMNFNADFTQLNSINVYDGELDVLSNSDLLIYNISYCSKIILSHIKSVTNAPNMIHNNSILNFLSLPNLETVKGGAYFVNSNNALKQIFLPNLKTISGGNSFQSGTSVEEINIPELEEITSLNVLCYNVRGLKVLKLPKLKISRCLFFEGSHSLRKVEVPLLYDISSSYGAPFQNLQIDKLSLLSLHKATAIIISNNKIVQIDLGNGVRDGVAGDIKVLNGGTNTYLATLTVAEGFKAKLNLTGCNGLSREVLVDILNNLADLMGTEYADKLQLILGTTLYNKLTADDILIATNKHWLVS